MTTETKVPRQMNEAPKTIWIDLEGGWYLVESEPQYLRADLVADLVESLEDIPGWKLHKNTPWAIRAKIAMARARGER